MKIKISKNGPYKVSGNIPLLAEEIVENEYGESNNWKKLKSIKTGKEYNLCRCGKTKTPPFCDGQHQKTKFQTEEISTNYKFKDEAISYSGPKYTLLDNENFCASLRFCHHNGSVWQKVLSSSAEDQAELIADVKNCASGRLVLINNQTEKEIEDQSSPAISATQDTPANVDGPLWVKGGIKIEDTKGNIYEKRQRVTLCRCGKSTMMPFCDSSHLDLE